MEGMITLLGRLIRSFATPARPKCMCELSQREYTLSPVFLNGLLAEAAKEAQIVLSNRLSAAPFAKFAYGAVIIQHELRRFLRSLHALGITKKVFSYP